jgi:pyridinium-3,5-biscarboxylic acid mononucleotide synthase
VILGEGKAAEHLLGILRACREQKLGALVSRPTPAQRTLLARSENRDLKVRALADGRLLRLPGPLGVRFRRGVVGILAAGTSDVPSAEEARLLLEELGIGTVHAYDVGVAGLHRLLRAIRTLEKSRPEIYLVLAGREGALATVVAGLVAAPVVGVPTSNGYGRGGRGEAALAAMLQSCAPLAVVNIDAAVPAALFAAQHFLERPPAPLRRPPHGSRRSRSSDPVGPIRRPFER